MLPAPPGEQLVARGPGRFLEAARWFVAGPDQNFVADAARPQPAAEEGNLGAAFRPQPMIDAESADFAAASARPAIGEKRQGETVGAAGDADRDQRARLEDGQPVEGGREVGVAQFRLQLPAQQPSRFFSAAAVDLIAARARGKAWSSWPKATQAFFRWPARASDMPSLKRSSGALFPLGKRR